MKPTRAELAAELEQWAEDVEAEDLVAVDSSALQLLSRLAAQRESVESELAEAVRVARSANRTWSEIGTMLGVSKQAAQRKYARHSQAA
jgi:hypothetical protein